MANLAQENLASEVQRGSKRLSSKDFRLFDCDWVVFRCTKKPGSEVRKDTKHMQLYFFGGISTRQMTSFPHSGSIVARGEVFMTQLKHLLPDVRLGHDATSPPTGNVEPFRGSSH